MKLKEKKIMKKKVNNYEEKRLPLRKTPHRPFPYKIYLFIPCCCRFNFHLHFISGIIILLALSTLTPYFFFIPKASLSAVIICAVIFMIEYEVVKPMWKSSRKDLIPTVVTFVLCLLIGVEYGILVGVAINIIILLYPSARPSVTVEKASVNSSPKFAKLFLIAVFLDELRIGIFNGYAQQ